MILNPFNARDVLRRNSHCSSLIFGLNDSRETNNAVLNGNILRQQMGPRLPFQFGDELLPNGTVIHASRRLRLQSGQALEQVSSCYNANEPTVPHDWYALDPMTFQRFGDLGEGRSLVHGDHGCRHDVPGGAAMRL